MTAAKDFSAARPDGDVRAWQGNGEVVFRAGEQAEFRAFEPR